MEDNNYTNLKKKPILILDFDGVIADTYNIYLDFLTAKMKLSKKYAMKKLSESTTQLASKPSNIFFKLGQIWYYNRFYKYVQKQNTNLLFPDIIKEIKQINMPKIILTRAEKRICQIILKEEIKNFELIIGRREAKNKVKGMQKILKHPNFKNRSPIFITDTVADILEIQNVLDKNQIYAVSWGFSKKFLLQKYLEKDKIIDKPENLSQTLNQI